MTQSEADLGRRSQTHIMDPAQNVCSLTGLSEIRKGPVYVAKRAKY